jgi:hypothetical protein
MDHFSAPPSDLPLYNVPHSLYHPAKRVSLKILRFLNNVNLQKPHIPAGWIGGVSLPLKDCDFRKNCRGRRRFAGKARPPLRIHAALKFLQFSPITYEILRMVVMPTNNHAQL